MGTSKSQRFKEKLALDMFRQKLVRKAKECKGEGNARNRFALYDNAELTFGEWRFNFEWWNGCFQISTRNTVNNDKTMSIPLTNFHFEDSLNTNLGPKIFGLMAKTDSMVLDSLNELEKRVLEQEKTQLVGGKKTNIVLGEPHNLDFYLDMRHVFSVVSEDDYYQHNMMDGWKPETAYLHFLPLSFVRTKGKGRGKERIACLSSLVLKKCGEEVMPPNRCIVGEGNDAQDVFKDMKDKISEMKSYVSDFDTVAKECFCEKNMVFYGKIR